MKKLAFVFGIMALVVYGFGAVHATPISFDVADEPHSYVTTTETTLFGNSSLTASLVEGLDDVAFSLDVGQSETFDFLELTTSGSIGAEKYEIDTTLAFDKPSGLSASFQGDGAYLKFFGFFTINGLEWENDIIDITLSDNTLISIALEQGCEFVLGDTVTLQATVTNNGVAPVPEPASMLLLGTGLAGMGAFLRKRKKEA